MVQTIGRTGGQASTAIVGLALSPDVVVAPTAFPTTRPTVIRSLEQVEPFRPEGEGTLG